MSCTLYQYRPFKQIPTMDYDCLVVQVRPEDLPPPFYLKLNPVSSVVASGPPPLPNGFLIFFNFFLMSIVECRPS